MPRMRYGSGGKQRRACTEHARAVAAVCGGSQERRSAEGEGGAPVQYRCTRWTQCGDGRVARAAPARQRPGWTQTAHCSHAVTTRACTAAYCIARAALPANRLQERLRRKVQGDQVQAVAQAKHRDAQQPQLDAALPREVREPDEHLRA